MNSNGDLAGTVFEQLEQLIAAGQIRPGEKINENQLAQKLKISRGPIREAIRRLEQYGLVEVIPHKGAVLRKLGFKEILDLYDVRAGLAYAAGTLLPIRATSTDIAELKGLLEDMENAAIREDSERFTVLNETFHRRLFAIAGNEPLMHLAEQQEILLKAFLQNEIRNPRMLRHSNAQHRSIIEAIVYNDQEGCAKAFHHHIIIGKQRLVEHDCYTV
jgi:DNA-binding GntR family transcriptional regulator